MSHLKHARARRTQTGATLLVSMIFLVVLTLIVASAIKVSNVNSTLAGNVQIQKESEAAAQQAIEAAISNPNFLTLPPISTVQVNIDDSGQTASTYAVSVPAPTCVSFLPIPQSAAPATDPFTWSATDQACFAQSATTTNANSNCSNSNWDFSATATAPSVTTTNTTTHQGIAIRVMNPGTGC
jgi:hypothetical protein